MQARTKQFRLSLLRCTAFAAFTAAWDRLPTRRTATLQMLVPSIKGRPRRSFRRSGLTRHLPDAISQHGRFSATPICTPRSPSMPGPSVRVCTRCLSLCQGRADRRLIRTTGQTVEAARFPGRGGSFRQYGVLSGDACRKIRTLADPIGRKWYDMIQAGKVLTRRSKSLSLSPREHFLQQLLYAPWHARLSFRLARNHQGCGRGR